ncbi:YozE family protein [Phytohabitans houttuyneae]|uniref:YozE SAM-like domain-containing protein n=1 Tax=Phytohabitans houttuyneae TaxID=1076126 RepID=A0A6V8KFA9_9ACTN|nr:YozE family protein [Phytohabitans houttuyneae]GFJ79425.1 hypothetical protein Phou_036050 [Phytohabitans houttuyneae]
MADDMTEDDIRRIPAEYKQQLAAAQEEAIRTRDEKLRRAAAAGWKQVELVELTGYSRETVRQALNPDAREQTVGASAGRRVAQKTASFRDWLRTRKDENTPVGDLARDVFADGSWPRGPGSLRRYEQHLKGLGADPGAVEALREAWRQYELEAGAGETE